MQLSPLFSSRDKFCRALTTINSKSKFIESRKKKLLEGCFTINLRVVVMGIRNVENTTKQRSGGSDFLKAEKVRKVAEGEET